MPEFRFQQAACIFTRAMNQATFFSGTRKLGILGGGQLGKMLLECTRRWDVYTKVMDPDPAAPGRMACNEFVVGSLLDYEKVIAFGKDCDVVTIEIEHVNTEALQHLKKLGIKIHPDPEALATIQDKGLQKMFYRSLDLPTADFALYNSALEIIAAIESGRLNYPFVQKSRKAGYDGKGVSIIRSATDLDKLMDTPSVVEDCIALSNELAVIAVRNEDGELACFDPVSMDFHPEANLLDLLLYPAPLSETLCLQAKQMALQLIEAYSICGLLAVEFLIDTKGQLWINEVAPRPHNSGHQTIESSFSSQYEQHLRGILNLPLGSTDVIRPSAMVNLLGAEGYSGPVRYEGLLDCLHQEGIYIHLYGKQQTRPFRKMGHVTVTDTSLEEAKKRALWVKETIQVKSLS